VTDPAAAVFLGIIALATLVMATIQVGAIVFAARVAKRVNRLADQVEHEIKPLLTNLTEVSQHAVRASSLAVEQVERADRLFATVAERVDETFTLVQSAIIRPAREGRAVVSAVRAAVAAFRELRAARKRSKMDDEDALFIG
jgi:predicted PurR-regulated permease PerM